jgi:hypothetical protein
LIFPVDLIWYEVPYQTPLFRDFFLVFCFLRSFYS